MTSKTNNQSATSKINRIINSFERSVCNISQDIRSRRQTKANTEANARNSLQTTLKTIKNPSSQNIPQTTNNDTSSTMTCNSSNSRASNDKIQSSKGFLATVKKDNIKLVLDNTASNAHSSSRSSLSSSPKSATNIIEQSSINAPFLPNTLRKQHTIPPHAIEMVRNLRSINNHYDISLASYPTNIATATSTLAPTTQLPQQNSAIKGNAKNVNVSDKSTSDQQSQTKSVKEKLDEFDEEESAFATYQSRRVSRNVNNTLQSSANLANKTNHNVIMMNLISNHSNSHNNSTADRTLPIQPRSDQMTLRSGDKYPNDTNHNARLYRPSDITKSQPTMEDQKQQQNTIQSPELKLDAATMTLDYRTHQSNNDASNISYLNQPQYTPSQCYGNTTMQHSNVTQQKQSARTLETYQNSRKDLIDQPELKPSSSINMHTLTSGSRGDLIDSSVSDINQIYVNAPPKPRRYQYYPTDTNSSNEWMAQSSSIAPESTYGCIPVYLPNNVSTSGLSNQQNIDPSVVSQMSTKMLHMPHSIDKMRTLNQSNIRSNMQNMSSAMIRYDHNGSEGYSNSSPLLNDKSISLMQRKALQQSSSIALQAAAAANAKFYQSKDGHTISDQKLSSNISSPNATASLMPKDNMLTQSSINMNSAIDRPSINNNFDKSVVFSNRSAIVSRGVPASIFSVPKSKSSLEARDVARFASMKRQQQLSMQQQVNMQPNLMNLDKNVQFHQSKQNPHLSANQSQYIQSDLNRPFYPVQNLDIIPSKSEYNLSSGFNNTSVNSQLIASPNVNNEFRFNNFVNSSSSNNLQAKIISSNIPNYLQPQNLLQSQKTTQQNDIKSLNNTLLRSKSVTHLSDQNMRQLQEPPTNIPPFAMSQLDINGHSLNNPQVIQNISISSSTNDGIHRDIFCSEDEEVARIQDKKRIGLSNGWGDNIHAPVMLFSDGHRHRCMTSTDIDFLQRQGFGLDIQRIQGIGNRSLNETTDIIKPPINYTNNSNLIYGSHDRIFAPRDIKIQNSYNLNPQESIYSCDPNNNNMGNRQQRQYDITNHSNQYDPTRTISNQSSNNYSSSQQLRNPIRYHNVMNGLVQDGRHQNNPTLHTSNDSHSIVDLTTPRILSTTKTILAPYNDCSWSNEVGLPISDIGEELIRRSVRSDKTRPLIESRYSSHSLLRNDFRSMNFHQRAPTPPRLGSLSVMNGYRKQQDASSQTTSNCVNNSITISSPTRCFDESSKMVLPRQSVGCNTDIRSSQSHHALGIVDMLTPNKSEDILKQNPAYPKFYVDKVSDNQTSPEASERSNIHDGERPTAPYYYSDLKSEDQQRALLEIQQKKSLSPPPQLLSRSLGQNKLNNSTRLMLKSPIVPQSSEVLDKLKSGTQIKAPELIKNKSVGQNKETDEINHSNNVRSASLASTLTIKSDNGMPPDLDPKRSEYTTNSSNRTDTKSIHSANPRLTSNITRNIDRLIEGKSISILEEKLKEKNFNNLALNKSKDNPNCVSSCRGDKPKQTSCDDIINRSKSLENIGLQESGNSDLKLPWIPSKTISCNLQEYQDHPVYENINNPKNDDGLSRNKSKKYENSSSSSRNSLESMIDLSLDTASNSDTMDTTVPSSTKGFKNNLHLDTEKNKDSCHNMGNLTFSNIDSNLAKLLDQLKSNHSELTENYRKTLSKLTETTLGSDLSKRSLDRYNINANMKSLGCQEQCENQLALINMIENMILECKSIQLKDSVNYQEEKYADSPSNNLEIVNLKQTSNTSRAHEAVNDSAGKVSSNHESQIYENISKVVTSLSNEDTEGKKQNRSPTNSSETSSVLNANNSSSTQSSPSLNQDTFMNSNDSGFVALESTKISSLSVREDEVSNSKCEKSLKNCEGNSNFDVSAYENIDCRTSLDPSSNNRFGKYSKASQPRVKHQPNSMTVKDQKDTIGTRARTLTRPLSLSARHQQSIEHKNKKLCDKQEEKSSEAVRPTSQRTKSAGPPPVRGNAQTSLTLSAKSRLLHQHRKVLLTNSLTKIDDSTPAKSDSLRCLSNLSRNNKFELEKRKKNSFDESALKSNSSSNSKPNVNGKSARYNLKRGDDTNKSADPSKRQNFDDDIDMIEFIPHENGGFSSSQFSASDFDTDASNVTDFDRDQFNGSVLGNVVGVDSTIDLHDDITDPNNDSAAANNH